MVTTSKAVNVIGDYHLKIMEAKKTRIDFESPFEIFQKIYAQYPCSFLLESMESDSGLARFSVLGFQPVATLKAQNGVIEIENDGFKEEIETQNPFDEIKKIIHSGKGKKGFRGGLVGYVSYEAARYFEPIEMEVGESPDYEFGLFLDAIIFDRLQNKCEYVTMGENRLCKGHTPSFYQSFPSSGPSPGGYLWHWR
jgi:anthranilate synthase component I